MKFNISKYFIYFLLIVSLTGCATQKPSITPTSPTASISLVKLCKESNVDWQWDYLTQVVTLTKGNHEAKAIVGSDQVIVNGQLFKLSRPVTIAHSVVYVPEDFKTQVIKRIKETKKTILATPVKQQFGEVSKRNVRTIVVDAGHGGKDPGTIGDSGTYEKDIVLDICKRLRKLLRGYGYEVVMTRDSDEFISLQRRTEIASMKKADLFVSVHANSSPTKSVRGVEVFAAKNLTFTDKQEEQRLKNHGLLYENYVMKKEDRNVDIIISDLLYDYKQTDSKLLAEILERTIEKVSKVKSRGIKQSRFFVLRNNIMPAVLVEVGFLSNPKEEKQLKESNYRQEVAQAIADGINIYAKSQ